MTITTTLKKFEILKAAILKDGKIDIDEAEVLLDFIDDYAKAGNRNFVELYKALINAKMDGVIDQDESQALIHKINEVSIFLERERKIETILSVIAGIIFILGLVYFI